MKLVTKALPFVVAAAGFFGVATSGMAQDLKVAIPATPPIWAGMVAHVADQEGFYKKYGFNDVLIQAFPIGPQATGAAGRGEFHIGIGPTSPASVAISNAKMPVVGIAGQNNSDWLIGSTNADKVTCKSIEGETAAVDRRGGIRFIQLAGLLRTCGLNPGNVGQLIEVRSAVDQELISGRATFGVLHADDVPVIESTGVKVHTVAIMADIQPNAHYVMHFANTAALAKDRDFYVRVTAAHIEAFRFMNDPANVERVAAIGGPETGRARNFAIDAVKFYQSVNYFPVNDNGLDRKKVEASIAVQKRVGNIEGVPVKYDDMVDLSIYADALKLVDGK